MKRNHHRQNQLGRCFNGVLCVWVAACFLALFVGCDDGGTVGAGGDAGGDAAADAVVDAVVDAAPVVDGTATKEDAGVDAAPLCVPPENPCEDEDGEISCGPVFEPCSGNVFQCDNLCAELKNETCDPVENPCVCNIYESRCVAPLLTSDDLKAEYGFECGLVRNAAGCWVFLGSCAADERCDADTNTCVECGEVTCANLGIECGEAWSGCGSRTDDAARLDCGDPCAAKDQVCNTTYNVCESDCTPPANATEREAACDAANAECGTITDGCGGTINCDAVKGGCTLPEMCGVRGVPNRCDIPERQPQCIAAGRECGEVYSECLGKMVSCGECDTENGEECRADGTCGPACEVLTCDSPEYDGKCGELLDNGCEGTIRICSCDGEQICSTQAEGVVGECQDRPNCTTIEKGDIGQECSVGGDVFTLPDGNTTDCPCDSTIYCITGTAPDGTQAATGETGVCCENTATQCADTTPRPCTITDSNNCIAGNQNRNCCTGNLICDNDEQVCVTRPTCSQLDTPAGGIGQPCSSGDLFQLPNDTYMDCPCTGTNTFCIVGTAPDGTVVNATQIGTCCQNTASQCSTTGGPCDITDTNNCLIGDQPGECCEGYICNNATGLCIPEPSCSDLEPPAGGEDQPCSSGDLFELPDGTYMDCPCNGDMYCITGTEPNRREVDETEFGTCCDNDAPNCASAGTACAFDNNTCLDNGETIEVCCSGSFCNSSDQCETCDSWQSSGGADGDKCGRFSRGEDSRYYTNCRCDDMLVCIVDDAGTMRAARTGEEGTCCTNDAPTCADEGNTCTFDSNSCISGVQSEGTGCCEGLSCNISVTPNRCAQPNTCEAENATGALNAPCGSFAQIDGSTFNCGCDGSLICLTATHRCGVAETCTSLDATGAIGDDCGNLDRGDGQTIWCSCNNSADDHLENNRCVSNVCTCTPYAEPCVDQDTGTPLTGTQSTGCGGTVECSS